MFLLKKMDWTGGDPQTFVWLYIYHSMTGTIFLLIEIAFCTLNSAKRLFEVGVLGMLGGVP